MQSCVHKNQCIKSFEGTDSFTDEKGVVNQDMPQTTWKVEFKKSGTGTTITTTITAETKEALEKCSRWALKNALRWDSETWMNTWIGTVYK